MTDRDGICAGVRNPSSQAIKEIDVIWITAGFGCDGDTISITAATQPSLEDVVLGGIPGIPKVNFHNPFLAYENGEEFMDLFYRGADRFWRHAHSGHAGR
jgi:hydrogenase small subunit